MTHHESEALSAVLANILREHLPTLLWKVNIERLDALDRQEIEQIRDALESEFCESGLDEHDHPNTLGRQLEDLIALLPLPNDRTDSD